MPIYPLNHDAIRLLWAKTNSAIDGVPSSNACLRQGSGIFAEEEEKRLLEPERTEVSPGNCLLDTAAGLMLV